MFLFITCTPIERWKFNNNKEISGYLGRFDEIQKRKELRAVVDYNSINYFVFEGEPMGFQYDLLKALAKDMNVELKIDVSNNIEESFKRLNQGAYDLVAKNLTVTGERKKTVDLTEPLAMTRQVLVQRSQFHKTRQQGVVHQPSFISESTELAGQTIYIPKNSVFAQRLKNLSEEIGSHINTIELPHITSEQLIEMVASGQIDYTVCHEMVALVNKRYFSSIDVSVPVSLNQKISWAVPKGATEWLNYIDEWIVQFRETAEYRQIYKKYFNSSAYHGFAKSEFHSNRGGKISRYDHMIKEIAGQNNWDWRLIASIVMQESKFDTEAESWRGAAGLMQLMPQTADRYRVSDVVDPRENIRGGVEHLSWLNEVFVNDIKDEQERLKFVLAAYNVGLGHVIDARKLAEKYGKNPSVWKDNVDFFIQNKSKKEYYQDPVVKWGYCRGEETYRYVNHVLDRYHHYVNVLPDPDENEGLSPWPVLQASLR